MLGTLTTATAKNRKKVKTKTELSGRRPDQGEVSINILL